MKYNLNTLGQTEMKHTNLSQIGQKMCVCLSIYKTKTFFKGPKENFTQVTIIVED